MAERLERFLGARAAAGAFPGASWWVERLGAPARHGAVGAATVEPRVESASEATVYDLASLTKPLVTGLLLVLAEQDGMLDLDAPAAAWVEELRGSALGGATLAALAAHRAGLPAWRPLYVVASDLESYLVQIAREPPAGVAGRTLYSDLGYVVLQAVLERACGAGLADLFVARVSAPLGLGQLAFAHALADPSLVAPTEHGNAYERRLAGEAAAVHGWRAHVLRGEVHDANAWGLGGVGGHAGLFGTAVAVAALAREILAPERLDLGARARRRLLEPLGPGADRTIGFATAASAAAARGILPDEAPGHTGFTGTSLWLDPWRGEIYVLLTNRVHPRVPSAGFAPVRRGFHRLARRSLLET